MAKKRIGVLTGGGDCPGLNAVIRAVFRTAFNFGWDVLGIQESFDGLIYPEKTKWLANEDVRGILHTGGTILGTSNRTHPFRYPVKTASGIEYQDRSEELIRNFREMGLDGLVVIGGDGTLTIGLELYRRGVPVVGVPKTIDNDVAATDITFGFDSAVGVVTDALDRLHTTAASHRRVMVIEVMGRNVGWIALHGGVAGGADAILIPEVPFDMNVVAAKVRQRNQLGRPFSIIVAAEGAAPIGGQMVFQERRGGGYEGRLGGIAEAVARGLSELTPNETRALTLGHLQRGGPPTTFDRVLGTRFGSAAVRLAQKEGWGRMVALSTPQIVSVPLESAVAELKRVPPEHDLVVAARDLGITFGEPPREAV